MPLTICGQIISNKLFEEKSSSLIILSAAAPSKSTKAMRHKNLSAFKPKSEPGNIAKPTSLSIF